MWFLESIGALTLIIGGGYLYFNWWLPNEEGKNKHKKLLHELIEYGHPEVRKLVRKRDSLIRSVDCYDGSRYSDQQDTEEYNRLINKKIKQILNDPKQKGLSRN